MTFATIQQNLDENFTGGSGNPKGNTPMLAYDPDSGANDGAIVLGSFVSPIPGNSTYGNNLALRPIFVADPSMGSVSPVKTNPLGALNLGLGNNLYSAQDAVDTTAAVPVLTSSVTSGSSAPSPFLILAILGAFFLVVRK